MTLLFALSAASAACEDATTNEDLVVALEKAMDAYGQLDRNGFEASMRDAKAIVGCLEQVIARPTAAELHRATALSAFLARDEDLAKQRFAAARTIESEYSFPDTLVPVGNPIHDLYKAFDPASSPIETLPPPAEGSLRLNGSVGTERPTLLPVVFQRLDGSGAVVDSTLLSAGAPPPPYEPGKTNPDGSAKKKKSPMVPLLIAAGVLGAGAIGSQIGAQVSGNSYKDHMRAGPSGAGDFVGVADRKRGTTNALTLTSAGLGVAAVGTGAVAVITGVF